WEQGINKNLRLDSSIFYNHITDLINQQLDPKSGFYQFANQAAARSYGFETELDAKWAKGWQSRLSYTFARVEDAETGATLSNSPEHMAKFNLIAPLWRDKIFGSIEIDGMSTRKTVNGGQVSGFYIVNTTLFTRQLLPGLEFSGSIYNLLDRHYSDPV